MGVVYRYIDLNDNNIKYVGIVWSGNRTLKQRVEEHYNNDSWCDRGHWRIEYVLRDVNTRTDAEYLEENYNNKSGLNSGKKRSNRHFSTIFLLRNINLPLVPFDGNNFYFH